MKDMRSQMHIWERSLAILPDTIFLDIVRNFIGKVPTPFHKPLLTKKLTTLFSTDEFLARVEASLSPTDKQLLSGAYVLGSPTQDELCSMFCDAISYATLQQNVVNLEERLLLVPNPDTFEHSAGLMINPLVVDRLLASSLALEDIFAPASDADTPHYRFLGGDPRIVRALLSLHIHATLGSREKSEKVLASKYMLSVFGQDDAPFTERILLYNRMLFGEKVLVEHGRSTRIDINRAQVMLSKEPGELQLLLFQTALASIQSQAPKISKDIPFRAFFIILSTLLDTIPIHGAKNLRTACLMASYRSRLPIANMEEFIALLGTVGLVSIQEPKKRALEQPHLQPAIDSDLTISFTEDVPLVDDRDLLHCLAFVRKVDVVTSYEVNKATIMRAFDLGLTVEEILRYLEGLTDSIPQGLQNLIGHWKEEFSSIVIYDGILVKANERLSRIIEALPTLQPFLISRIADGMYLFSRSSEAQWREILSSTGIGLLPRSITDATHHFPTSIESSSAQGDREHLRPIQEPIRLLAVRQPDTTEPDALEFQKELRKAILSKASNKGEQEEMLARLERKLILVPSQISAVQGRTQTMQASGFDFQGKINLCKAAVNSTVELLELHILDHDGNSQMLLTEAKELINSTKDASIRVLVLPGGEEKVLPIEKIFKVRKLRRSIFFQM